MKEFHIYDQLSAIRRSLERDRSLRETTKGGELTAEDRLLKRIFEPATRIARSDSLIDSEELTAMNLRIDETRDFLFQHGQDFTKHPEYPHLNKMFVSSKDEVNYRNNFWFITDDFQRDTEPIAAFDVTLPGIDPDSVFTYHTAPMQASADKIQPEEDPIMGARLRLRVVDREHYVYIKFGFDGSYVLTINFFDTPEWNKSRAHYENPTELEYTADLPMKNMTREEADIIQHYLGEFDAKVKGIVGI